MMVLLLSNRKNKCENEIIEILQKYGAQYISDKYVSNDKGDFTILSIYKKCELKINKGIAVFLDNKCRFSDQKIPVGIIGICEEENFSALEILKNNKIATVCCGMGNKNSITLSSVGNDALFTCLQRSLQNSDGEIIEQGEYKIKLTKSYLPFSVMASAAILLLKGITPYEF
ncbi:MAG: hypothetical protein J6C27_00190 [Clostridia bacterium]|nr:hypothetical protein [Clostridia bacterium]